MPRVLKTKQGEVSGKFVLQVHDRSKDLSLLLSNLSTSSHLEIRYSMLVRRGGFLVQNSSGRTAGLSAASPHPPAVGLWALRCNPWRFGARSFHFSILLNNPDIYGQELYFQPMADYNIQCFCFPATSLLTIPNHLCELFRGRYARLLQCIYLLKFTSCISIKFVTGNML